MGSSLKVGLKTRLATSRSTKPRCVTRTLLLLSATMAPACARPASPETTPPGPSSPPLSDVPATRESWSVWDRRMPMSVTRPSPREVSSPSSTPSSTESSPTGTTWRRSGTTPSTTSSALPPRSSPSSSPRPPSTPRPTGRRCPRSCSRPSTCPPCTSPSRLCSPCTPLAVPPVSSWTPVTVSPTASPSTRVTPSPRHRPSGPGWPRADQLPDEDPHREGLLLHHHRREGDRPGHQGEAELRGPGLRAGDVHCRRLHLPGEVLRASRRPGDHHRQREVQVSRGSLPAQLPGNGVLRYPRDHLQLHHEVRRRYQEGPLRQHCPLWRHHHVPWNRRQNAEGDHRPGSLHHEDQDHRSPREEVLRLDRRLHPGFPLHLPADVDLQAGVR